MRLVVNDQPPPLVFRREQENRMYALRDFERSDCNVGIRSERRRGVSPETVPAAIRESAHLPTLRPPRERGVVLNGDLVAAQRDAGIGRWALRVLGNLAVSRCGKESECNCCQSHAANDFQIDGFSSTRKVNMHNADYDGVIVTNCLISLLLAAISLPLPLLAQAPPEPGTPVRIAVAGLVHGHVEGFLLRPAQTRADIRIVGIFEPDITLAEATAKRYKLPASLLYTNLQTMLDRVKPDALAVFTNTFDHARVVEAAAPRHIPVMMEKPLAVSMEHARRIQNVAERYDIPIVVDYETSWYPSHGAMWKLLKEQKAAGQIRRLVAMDGHQGQGDRC